MHKLQNPISFDKEIWKAVNGYPNYEVSTLGRIMNIKRGKLLSPYISNCGYRSVALCNGSKPNKTRTVHRVVALNLIENPNRYLFVNHMDANKLNNAVSNLEWVTRVMNHRHAKEMGLFPRGESHYNSSLTELIVIQMRYLYKKGMYTFVEIAKMFNITPNHAGLVIHGVRWEHVDYYPGLPDTRIIEKFHSKSIYHKTQLSKK